MIYSSYFSLLTLVFTLNFFLSLLAKRLRTMLDGASGLGVKGIGKRCELEPSCD